MGIRLETIRDPRLRSEIERRLFTQEPTESRKPLKESETVENESALHDKIIELCRSQGWYYVHSRMDRRSTVGVGTPDFCIALPKGVTVWLECKRKGGKPTVAQNAALAQLKNLGHASYVVEDLTQVTTILGIHLTGSVGAGAGAD